MKLVRFINIVITSFILLTLISSCKKDNGGDIPPVEEPGKLEKISEINLDIKEPSGLALGPNGQTLLIVSDNTNTVYETNMQGSVIRELEYVGSDLEGVAFNSTEQLIAVVEERKRQIVFLDYIKGEEQYRFDIHSNGITENKGLEGVSYNNNNDAYYIVNEDLPGEMIVWSKEYGHISNTELHFASDYSAVFVDTKNALVWMVSDESQALYKCDYNAELIKEYPLPDTKFEGLTIDVDKQLVYLVNDKTFKLFTFKILN